MHRKILLTLFVVVLLAALIYKSPLSAMYNYNQAKSLLDNGKYEQSLPYFERAIFADPSKSLTRYFYAEALAKSKPTYSVQKKLYELSQHPSNDNAAKYAKSKATQVKYTLLKGIGDNYIYNAASGKDIVRWSTQSFPLKVYIEKSDVPQYYYGNIRSALGQWTNRTTFIKFTEVNNESDAQIVIRFRNIDSSICGSGTCKYVVAYTEPQISGNNTLKQMVLTFYKTNPRNQNFSQNEIYKTALHELGHTLGIMGHSDYQGDIMYASQGHTTLSGRDLKTLVLLYRTKPTITDKAQSGETFYYAPLVIGEDDVLINKKIEELTKYIRTYPHMATGYINLGGAYGDIGEFEKALQNMGLAERYAKTSDERYLIYYNKAIIYYNMQNYDRAMQYAQQAQSIKNEPSVAELIQEINDIPHR